MGDLSTHFSSSEFRDRRAGKDGTIATELVGRLEALRCRIGRPLPILSGFRTPATNRAVGGARDSWHLRGAAADIPKGLVTIDQARAAGFRGIGHRDGWVVHVDVRPGPVTIFAE